MVYGYSLCVPVNGLEWEVFTIYRWGFGGKTPSGIFHTAVGGQRTLSCMVRSGASIPERALVRVPAR